jgi:starch synthase
LDLQLDQPVDDRRITAGVLTIQPRPGLTYYFVDQPQLYQRDELYQERGVDYWDNAVRFAFLSKCVVQLARDLPWRPELVHVHDWHVGLVPLLIRHEAGMGRWPNPPRTCLTIHNLAFQGLFPPAAYRLTNLPWDYFHLEGAEFHGRANFLKAGIAYADELITVSPGYAREITTSELGYGLQGILQARRNSLTGILNGVDYDEWRTTRNPFLAHAYSARRLNGKARNKLALQKELGLPARAKAPLFGVVSRLTDQKGMDVLLPALEEMLASGFQFALLGAGQPEYEAGFTELAQRHSSQVAVHLGYDAGLAHRIEAASDFFLMPSLFEPCGLNQMYSLRYGAVPVVRATGGLNDSVVDLREDPLKADGIKFHDYSAGALAKAIRKALALFQAPDLLAHLRRNGMAADFSWEQSAAKYLEVYRRAAAGGASPAP